MITNRRCLGALHTSTVYEWYPTILLWFFWVFPIVISCVDVVRFLAVILSGCEARFWFQALGESCSSLLFMFPWKGTIRDDSVKNVITWMFGFADTGYYQRCCAGDMASEISTSSLLGPFRGSPNQRDFGLRTMNGIIDNNMSRKK